jgi:peptidylprolyl isomerase
MPIRNLPLAAAVLAASLVLTACGKPAMPSSDTTPTESPKPAEAAPAETASTSKWSAAELASLKEKFGDLQETPSGLLYRILTAGDGVTKPAKGQRVTAHYTGTFPDGREFDSSVRRGQPFQFIAGIKQVIPAWDEAILEMSKGEKRIIVVPHFLGYGERGAGGVIPPRATLVFEMELLGMETPRLPGT